MKRVIAIALCLAATACNTTVIEQIENPTSSVDAGVAPGSDNLGCLYFDGNADFASFGRWGALPVRMPNATLWEFWMMGDPWGSGYDIVTDYSGLHFVLNNGTCGYFDFIDQNGALQRLPYCAENPPPSGTFSHIAFSIENDTVYGNAYMYQYINGIAEGKALVPKGYQRGMPVATGGGQVLSLGAFDHNGGKAWICQGRNFEALPVGWGGQPFAPRRLFTNWSDDAHAYPATWNVNFITPIDTNRWPDDSDGYDGYAAGYFGPDGGALPKMRHPGVGFRIGNGNIATESGLNSAHSSPFTAPAPFMDYYKETPPVRDFSAKQCYCPANAILCDCFRRPDQVYSHAAIPNPGCVEYAADGQQHCWWGHIGGPAPAGAYPAVVQLSAATMHPANFANVFPRVETGKTDFTVGARRSTFQYNDGITGVSGRLGYTFCGAAGQPACPPSPNGDFARVGKAPTYTGYDASYQYVPGLISAVVVQREDGPGKGVVLAKVAVPHTGWTWLWMKFSGATISVYTDSTLVRTLTDATYSSDSAGGYFPSIPQGVMQTNQSIKDWVVIP